MFSKRIGVDISPNSLSQLLEDKRKNGEKIVDLTQSNPTMIGLDYDAPAVLAALCQSAALRYDPEPCGLMPARAAISDYYCQLGCSVGPEMICLTASTSEAYAMLFKLVGDPEDQILIPSPGYPLLSYLARFEGLRSISYPLRYANDKGWYVDLDAVDARITDHTRAIVVVNPNNPTGNYLKQHELAMLEQICCQHDLALIVDEVFSDFHMDIPSRYVRTAAGNRKPLTFVLNGFSKMLALPQVKLGWIVIDGDRQQVMAAKKRLGLLLDFFLSVSAQVQHAVKALLEMRTDIQIQLQKRIHLNRQSLERQLMQTSNCHLLKSEGGWYAVVEIEDNLEDEERVLDLLTATNTLVHPGYFYEFYRDGFLVLSLLPALPQFQQGVTNIVQRFGRGHKA